MAETIRVWIMAHDDAEVGYVVNEHEDMLGNYEDMVADGIAQDGFEQYLDSWRSVEMPESVLNGPAPERIAWTDAYFGV